MTNKTPRTGNQYSIHYGDYSAVICELGAKIRVLKIGRASCRERV